MLRSKVLLAGAAILAVPAFAQDSGATTNSASPPAGAIDVGPSELSNFSLEGRVTREGAAAPTVKPATPQQQPAPSREQQPASASAESPRPRASVPDQPAQTTRPAPDRVRTPPRPAEADRPTPASAAPPPQRQARPIPATPLPEQPDGWSFLPWLAALLFAAGAAAIYFFFRSRRPDRQAYAAPVRTYSPPPEPVVPPPVPRAAPRPEPEVRAATALRQPLPTRLRPEQQPEPASQPEAAGIVATSLRPWIDIECSAERALIDDSGAAIAINLTLVNSGSAPARDVAIEACLINASNRQDSELSDFFGRPRAVDNIPIIPPQGRIPLRTAVRIPRESIREYEVEGRKLFMPMVAVNALYRWSSGEGQTGAGFMVGRGAETNQDRLAPLRTDQGARAWQELGARRYEKGLRR